MKFFRYASAFNTHDRLKLLALATMFIDHVGYFSLEDNRICRFIGRLAAPLFFFLIGHAGKVHLTLFFLLAAGILTVTDSLLNQHLYLNILFNFVLIHLFLQSPLPTHLSSTLKRSLFFLSMAIINGFSSFYLEYGTMGILFAWCGWLQARHEPQAQGWLFLTICLHFFWENLKFQFSTYFHTPVWGILFIGLLFLLLATYQLRPLACPPWLRWPAVFLARSSLIIYFIHLFLFHLYALRN